MSKNEITTQSQNNQESIIPVVKATIGENRLNAVDARLLHNFLEIKTRFNDWIERRITEYDFVINSDYSFLSTTNIRHQVTRNDYFISMDMAKELSMVERNEKGREARKYFIEIEKRYTNKQQQIPANFSEALQLAADQAKQLELQAPKVEFADTIIESKGSVSIGEFAKIHGEYGRNIMFKILRGEGVLMKDNVPYQKYVSEGYFELTEKDTPVGIKAVTRITGKGQAWLTMRLNKLKDN